MIRIAHAHAPSVFLVLATVIVFGASPYPAQASSFTWSGQPISGQDPSFLPSGTAAFQIVGSQLQLTLTNTSPQTNSIGQTLSGLTWSITDPTVTLAPVSAMIASGSSLVGVGATSATNLSSEWGFKSNLSVGSLGPFGIAAVGSVSGVSTFGPGDRFDTTTNLFPPSSGSLSGIDAAIVGLLVDLTADGFKTQGPVVQSSMIFTFNITGSLSDAEISNVRPLFGSTGATAVPEPSTLLLVGSGLVALGILGRKRLARLHR